MAQLSHTQHFTYHVYARSLARAILSEEARNYQLRIGIYMPEHPKNYAIIVGSGPNGLASAITLAQVGLSVAVFEAKETIGGGCRSMELTLPGFVHDVCSAIQPLALDSSFFRSLPLEQFGLEMIQPLAPLAHPLDDGTAVMLERSIEATAAGLSIDAKAYSKLM